jgi:hypothetical protein
VATGPTPNPETVEALLDTAWRLWTAEPAQTEALDRKAATLATFASLLASLVATLGVHSAPGLPSTRWLFVSTIWLLVGAVLMAIGALAPREYDTLGVEYKARLVRGAFALLALGLVSLTFEAAALAVLSGP